MRLLVFTEALIAIACRCVSDGVEGSCIEENHAQHRDDQDYRRGRHRLDDTDDQAVQIFAFSILRDEVSFPCHLRTKAIISKDNKGADRGTNTEDITAEDGLLDGSASRNITDEERRCNAPNHPISPVVNRPILREVVLSHRVHIGTEPHEILHHFAQALDTILNDESTLPANQQNKNLQAKEQINAKLSEEADPFESMKYSIGIHRTGNQQDDDRNGGTADVDAKQRNDDLSHQGRRNGERRGCTCKERKQRKQIDDSPEQAVRMLLPNHRQAGL